MSADRETRLLMICPSAKITPEMLVRSIHSLNANVSMKETCYGCLIEGTEKDVREMVEYVRKLERNAIFTKRRAYRMGDPVRCRAQHGTRPGFSQLEEEWSKLPVIKAGLDALDRGEKIAEQPRKEKLSVTRLKEICEVK